MMYACAQGHIKSSLHICTQLIVAVINSIHFLFTQDTEIPSLLSSATPVVNYGKFINNKVYQVYGHIHHEPH